MKETKEETKSSYIIVSDPDMDLVGNIIHQVKGMTPIADFGYDCGYTYRSFYKIASGQRSAKPLSEKLVDTILEKGREKCVDKAQFMAANGKIHKSFFSAIRSNMLSNGHAYSEDDKVIPYTETINAAENEAKKYLDFLDQICEFSAELDAESQKQLRKGIHSIYQLKGATNVLKDYCNIKKNISKSEAFLSQKNPSKQDVPEEIALCHDFEMVIADMTTCKSTRVMPKIKKKQTNEEEEKAYE